MKQIIKTFFTCAVVSALCFPVGYSIAQVTQGNTGIANSEQSKLDIHVSAQFKHAAMVMFEHEPFLAIDEVLLPGNDIIQNGIYLDLTPVQEAKVEVYGTNGEIARLGCEVQQMEDSSVDSFDPISSRDCSTFRGGKAVLLGVEPKSDIPVTNLNLGPKKVRSFVSLEISYI